MNSFIRLEEVSFRWPAGPAVLERISMEIAQSDTMALMGANGSGKTTMGKILMGILRPSSGRVLLGGRPVLDYSLAERGKRMGYVFQNPERQLFAATVADEIGFPLKFLGMSQEKVRNKVQEMLELFELEQHADAFPFNLSHGEKQRLALAAIMVLQPEFIILDEPSTGLDWLRKQRLTAALERVRERGVGFLLISHDIKFIQGLCARSMTLKGGRLV